MQNLECPHCHQLTIPIWRKQTLGPAMSATCSNCGGKVGVPYSAMWTVIPFLAAIFMASQVDSVLIAGALLVAGAAAMSWLYHRYIPLIPK